MYDSCVKLLAARGKCDYGNGGASVVDRNIVTMTGLRTLTICVTLFGVMTTSSVPILAQTNPRIPAARTADDRAKLNLRDFDFLVAKITANYSGWDTKVTPATRAELDALTARLRARAATASDDEFASVAREWIGFFKDRHVQFGPAPAPAASSGPDATATKVTYPSRDWTEASVRARLTALGEKRDPVEGIWSIGGDRYRIGILRDAPSHFVGVVLATAAEDWQPGQIKAEITRGADGKLTVAYRRGDHGEEKVAGKVVGSGAAIKLEGWGVWARMVPELADPDAIDRAFASDRMFLKRLSPTTMWLRMPDFQDDRFQPLKDLLEAHKADLATTSNLLIDLRENGGGADYVYESLLPFLYTRPIYSIGVEMRASADNLTLRREIADKVRKQSPDTAAQLDAQNVRMAKVLGTYFAPQVLPFSIQRYDKVLPFPKRVAVIIDGAGSTGEQFLLDARQSHKVTMFGQRNSAGVLDFANVVSMTLPSGRFGMAWATSRSLRLPDDPVDEGGISPDIRVPAEVSDPVKFVADWLERQRD